LQSTRPYLTLPMTLVANPYAEDDALAIPEGYIPDFWIFHLSGGRRLIRVSTYEEAVREVAEGRARDAIVNTYADIYHMQNH
ncbi:MAG: hypothetical protein LBS31_12710, partial [Candidatus Adiutrix sp.]|nr:hypothetical protein [Candidatus Adiutrix sp.]